MRKRFHLARIFGIQIDIHITFFLLLAFFFMVLGIKGIFLILGIFVLVTIHELCHGLMAARFGIKVERITLLPIGGVASMPDTPAKPYQEILISLAGPASNIVMLILFYYPLVMILGKETLIYPLLVLTGRTAFTGHFNILAHIYWINLMLAVFNMLPAFPMDGGRVLRAVLSYPLGFRKATAVAVKLGRIFALIFAYLGIVNGHLFLVIIAIFLFIAGSSEGMQVELQETIKGYLVRDIMSGEFVHITPGTPLSKVMGIMFHSHQEDFPVMENGDLKGFLTRKDVLYGMHRGGNEVIVGEIMRKDIPTLDVKTKLNDVQKLLSDHNTSAMPVEENGNIIGVVTMEDINRVYRMLSEK